MSADSYTVTTQPGNKVSPAPTPTPTEQPITTQPTSTSQPAQRSQSAASVSYADSDEHVQQFHCGVMRCCKRCCAEGADRRWYYPWDKGLLCCLPLGCGWCLIGLVFPCCLCIPKCRNIICMVQEGAWDGTCFGACICGIPRDGTGRPRSNSEDSY